MNLRRKIRQQIKRYKTTPAALAKDVGMDTQTMYNFLDGKSNMTSEYLLEVIKKLGGKVIFR